MSSLRTVWLSCAVAVVASTVQPGSAGAQDASGAAEVLFRDAQTLMAEGKVEEACTAFQRSQNLSPALGTLLNLANCHEKMGRTASAWGEFKEAAAQAARAGKADREKLARERVAALAPRVPRIEVKLEAPVGGEQLVIDERALGGGAFDAALPLDPGLHMVRVEAAGHQPFTRSVECRDGTTVERVVVPALARKPADRGSPMTESAPVATGDAAPELPAGSWRLPTAVSLVAIGVVGVGVGTGFAVAALGKKSDAEQACPDPARCRDLRGADAWNAAADRGDVATVSIGLGVAALASATVIWLTRPTRPTTTAPSSRRPRLLRSLGMTTDGVSLWGQF